MNRFLKGAMILTIAGVMVKVIGAISKVLLARVLGGEGIGLYQMAYLLYQLIISIGAAGLPISMSILISRKLAQGDMRGVQHIFKTITWFMFMVGALFSVAFYYLSPYLISYGIIVDSRAHMALLAVSPAIVMVSILACFRGYFQGFQDMLPTGVSQVSEQTLRVTTMLLLAILLMPYGLEWAAAGAALASVVGVLAGVLVLLVFYQKRKGERLQALREQQEEFSLESKRNIIGELLCLAIPVALANVMIPIVAAIDLAIVPSQLVQSGYRAEEATTAFGYLTGMATSLISLPIILTTSLAASLVPAVSEAMANGRVNESKERVGMAMRIANLITVPAFVGLCVLATPISEMMFATPHAGGAIAIMSVSIVFLGIQQVTTGALQGIGKTIIPMATLCISSLAKIVLSFPLVTQWGIEGAAWTTNIDFMIAAALNLYATQRYMGYRFAYGEVGKILFSALTMGGATVMAYYFINTIAGNTVAVVGAIILGCIVYSGALILTKAISEEDAVALPKVGKLIRKWKSPKE